jgi:acetyl-CoA C-acetyltransferase
LLNRSHSRGTFGGTLKDIPAVELGASVISAALRRSGLRPDEIGMAVLGNTVQAGNKMNPARQAAIHGGLPVQVPAMTVNRVCGSGAQAILSAAHEILVGSVDTAIAGGMENMDAAPKGPSWPTAGFRIPPATLRVTSASILSPKKSFRRLIRSANSIISNCREPRSV